MRMLFRVVRASLLRNLRVSGWMFVSLGILAALAAMFATVAIETGRKMRSSLRVVGANGVASAASSARLRASLADRTDVEACFVEARAATAKGQPLAVLAADQAELSRATAYWAVRGRRAAGAGEAIVGARLAARLHLAPDGEVDLELAGGPEAHLRVVGVFESGDEDEDRVFVSPQTPALSTVPPLASYALLSVRGGADGLRELEERLARQGVTLRPLRQLILGEEAVLGKVNLLSAVALAAVLALSALGVSAAVLARIVERRAELALMQAIGAPRAAIARLLLTEATVLGLAAAAAGFVLGSLLAWLVAWKVFGTGVEPHAAALAAAVLVACGVALFSGLLGLRRALLFDPAAALQGE
jgi:ABC-type lipoprotein release transport system permease subunit